MIRFILTGGLGRMALRGLMVSLLLMTVFDLQAQVRKRKQKAAALPVMAPAPKPIVLTQEGMSRYRILLPEHANAFEEQAAEVLQSYLLEISEAALPIIRSDQGSNEFEIVLGQNERLNQLGKAVDLNALKQDGFLIRTDSARLIIAGGTGKGTLYGVYSFLEKYLGCRMYTPKVKIIPKQKNISLDHIHDQQVPKIEFRTTHYKATWNKEYTDWHKLDHNENGGRPDWGMWVHTFNELIPPEIHFKEHPEYYAEVRGKRLPTQPCLSHPEVLNITIQNLRKKIAQNPEATYWSVSQNDNRDYCTCSQCRAIDEQEGSPSGSIIRFVNQVASQFPDKMISTLAYEYGRHAPKNLRPLENVNIMLCSIEALRHKAIDQDSASADFAKDLADWGRISKDIIIWDYVIQFPNLLSPFPNLHVLQPNLQLFVKHNVNAMFEQGNREVGGEFAELRSYLLSKLMWDPDQNVDTLMNDFLNGYYGAAGGFIRHYIDVMREALLQSGKPLRIFGGPNEATESYLSPALMERYNNLFDAAEQAVAGQPEVLERVRIARIPIQFATMEIAKKNYRGEGGLFIKKEGGWEVRPDIRSLIDPFTDLCIRQGVTRVKEWSTSPEEYRSSMYRLFYHGMKEHLAYGKKIRLISPDTTRISMQAAQMLTDGIRGGHDYAYNWITFQGQDLEAIVDLEEVKTVSRMESAYYQLAMWLRIFPKQVEYYTSLDGNNFELAGTVQNTLPIDQYGAQQRDFILNFSPRQARYVKIKAVTIGITPEWHPGAGRAPYMSIDEIVVN